MSFVNFYSGLASRFSFFSRKTVNRWTLMLPGAGCEYYKNCGGCSMCGFYQANFKYTHGLIYPSFIFQTMYKLAEFATVNSAPQELYVFNGGSFWNPKEIPLGFRNRLLKAVGRHKSLDRLLIESRVEYITDDKIARSIDYLSGKILTVGIGLESSNDYVRNSLIRKGLSLSQFERAVKLIKKYGGKVQSYVFLKPLGLKEEDALNDCLETIKYCHGLGIDEMVISCAFIQKRTKMAEAYNRAEYNPPLLWSIVSIIKESLVNNWPVSIGGFDDEPPPIAIPANQCPDDCSPAIYSLIESYRISGQFDFSRLPQCECRKTSGCLL